MANVLDQIAERTGLSRPTVKHVLGTRAHLYREETRKRVCEAAEELGWRPNAAAKAVSTGRFGAIGLLTSTDLMAATVHFDVLYGMQQALYERDLQLTMGQVPDAKLANERQLPRILREWSVDGLLISYTDHHPTEMLDVIRRHAIPSIWLNAKLDADCVYPDDFAAGRMATEMLIRAGHRRIGYATVWAFGHYSIADRYGGYVAAMRDAGLSVTDLRATPEERARVPAPAYYGRVAAAAADRGTTAIVTYETGDAEAIAAWAWKRGMEIPRDLSLSTVEREGPAGNWKIAMALMPTRELGRAAVEALLEKITNPQAALPPRAVRPTPVTGDTIAPPRVRD